MWDGTEAKMESCWDQDLPVYTHTHQDKQQRKTEQMGRFKCETYMFTCPFVTMTIMMETITTCWKSSLKYLASSSLRLGSGGEWGCLLTDSLHSLAGCWGIPSIGFWLHFIASSILLMSCISSSWCRHLLSSGLFWFQLRSLLCWIVWLSLHGSLSVWAPSIPHTCGPTYWLLCFWLNVF